MLSSLARIVFETVGGKALAVAGLFAALLAWHKMELAGERRATRTETLRTVEKNNAADRDRAHSAGSRSLSGIGGVRNPHYRD